ncbi:hypothetical protein BDZ94DRAFT_937197 [Collybia nuda]|uniref:Uncharacterized protein n=1 Tax=Collybia nuda TaxID=64659 RepID=A0A9P6CC84_9AGAR|nr:hypothetical protein BDZ94DRAFT_937197 [Collybia nuda]
MHTLNPPSIDENNPLYCPAVSATAYISSIRLHLLQNCTAAPKNRKNQHIVSFATILDKGLLSSDSEDENDIFPPRSLIRFPSPSSSDEDTTTTTFRNSIPAWERFNKDSELYNADDEWVGMRNIPIVPRHQQKNSKRKRSPFSDINGPSKFARSIQSVHDSSFDIMVRRESLVYSVPGSAKKRYGLARSGETRSYRKTPLLEKSKTALLARIRTLEDDLYGPPTGTESPRGIKSLIERLDEAMPGIRLKERLLKLDNLCHQKIVDFLADSGTLY